MRATRIEEEVEISATNLINKTKCMGTNTKKWRKKCEDVICTTSAICGVKLSQYVLLIPLPTAAITEQEQVNIKLAY
jgi:hypothetical protein